MSYRKLESRWLMCCVLPILSLTPANATPTQIVPLHTTLTFSSQHPKGPNPVPVKSTDGKTVYFLSLRIEPDVKNNPVGIDLVLLHTRASSDDVNLLDPTGKWHGIQPYIFPASDFAQGAEKSIYGEKRIIRLKHLGLELQITVSNVAVTPNSTPYSEYQFDALTLQINVDNLIR
jgi:hypothetical protein